jgi:AcrR family transcriptional regulator
MSAQAETPARTGEPGPNKQRLRTERSANALLEAAADLIVEGGFAALTFTAIGERAGYSRGLVTARFGSKSGLIDALIERIVTTWNHKHVIARTKGRPGLEGALTILDAIRAQAATDPHGLLVLYSLMFEATSDDDLRLRFAAFHEAMRGDFVYFIRKGQRDGSIRTGLSPINEATILVAGLRGIGYQWLLDLRGFDPVPPLTYLHDITRDRLAA